MSDSSWTALGFVIILLCISLMFCVTRSSRKPKAIDVYRGKTTLEITYRDSVAIDSVVVYKMK